MTSRITRPSLAELWRALLARLEREGIEDAPAVARSLAVAAFTGLASGTRALRVERRGAVYSVTAIEVPKAARRRTSAVAAR